MIGYKFLQNLFITCGINFSQKMKAYLFSGFLTTRLRIIRQDCLCIWYEAGNFFIAWMAKSPAPASIARAALSGDLRESTVTIDITCILRLPSLASRTGSMIYRNHMVKNHLNWWIFNRHNTKRAPLVELMDLQKTWKIVSLIYPDHPSEQ